MIERATAPHGPGKWILQPSGVSNGIALGAWKARSACATRAPIEAGAVRAPVLIAVRAPVVIAGADSPGGAGASAEVAAVAENAGYRGSRFGRLLIVIQFGEASASGENRGYCYLSLSDAEFLSFLTKAI